MGNVIKLDGSAYEAPPPPEPIDAEYWEAVLGVNGYFSAFWHLAQAVKRTEPQPKTAIGVLLKKANAKKTPLDIVVGRHDSRWMAGDVVKSIYQVDISQPRDLAKMSDSLGYVGTITTFPEAVWIRTKVKPSKGLAVTMDHEHDRFFYNGAAYPKRGQSERQNPDYEVMNWGRAQQAGHGISVGPIQLRYLKLRQEGLHEEIAKLWKSAMDPNLNPLIAEETAKYFTAFEAQADLRQEPWLQLVLAEPQTYHLTS